MCIRPCGQDTDYSFSPITFLTSHVSCGWWIFGHGVKGQVHFGILCIRPSRKDTDYSFSPIFFKLHMSVVGYERRDPIDFGSRVQRSRSTLALCIKPLCAQYRLQFKFNHFQTSNFNYGWWGEEPYWFLVSGSKGKFNIAHLGGDCIVFFWFATLPGSILPFMEPWFYISFAMPQTFVHLSFVVLTCSRFWQAILGQFCARCPNQQYLTHLPFLK